MRTPEERALCREMQGLLHDSIVWCPAREIMRDIRSFTRRFSNEGFAFVSKVLPSLAKALDKALSGNENFELPSNFKKKDGSAVPKFLGFAFSMIFDDCGALKPDVPADLIRWLRTFLIYAYKIEVPFSNEKIQEYSEAFIATDKSLKTQARDSALRFVMANQISDVLGHPDFGKPKYGPGISSDFPRTDRYWHYMPNNHLRKAFGRDFFHQPGEYAEEECFIIVWIGFLLANHISAELNINYSLNLIPILGGEEESISKVLFVPKDSRGPRVICCEPAYKMKAQQAVREVLYKVVQNHPRTQGFVNFDDQSINQKLTFDNRYATIDLKDASDRVSLSLVRKVFPPNWVKLFDVTRSPLASLPDGRVIRQKKFAPMGNALCFPVLALTAYVAITSGIYLAGGPLPKDNKDVFVYGDDIIVLNEWAEIAMSCLEEVDLLVNRSKSFINSQFLESCGQDTFRGFDVTSLKRRQMPVSSKNKHVRPRRITKDVKNLCHSVALANSLANKGYKNTSELVFKNVEDVLGRLPYGTTESPYLCRQTERTEDAWMLNGHVQEGEMEIRAYVIKDPKVKINHSPWSRLRSNLIDGGAVTPDLFGGIPPLDVNRIGKRQPVLLRTTLKQWYVGSYTIA